jgi:hypothetical protein
VTTAEEKKKRNFNVLRKASEADENIENQSSKSISNKSVTISTITLKILTYY